MRILNDYRNVTFEPFRYCIIIINIKPNSIIIFISNFKADKL